MISPTLWAKRNRHIGFHISVDGGPFRDSIKAAQRAVLGLRVAFIVGYNPQLLLTDQRPLWHFTERNDDWYAQLFATFSDEGHAIDFLAPISGVAEALVGVMTALTSAGRTARLVVTAPDPREDNQELSTAVLRSMVKAYIELDEIDALEIDLTNLRYGTTLYGVSYDFDAMIDRHNIRATKSRGRKQPDYLKHDPTKRNHRGRH